jgi:4-hydroxy-3-methylbut-2-en-1-yl diphosphate reductase
LPSKKKAIQIKQAREIGFCFGVRRAIKIILDASTEHKGIATLGPIVHNRSVVDKLRERGIEVVSDTAHITGNTIAVSSHGVSPDRLAELGSKNLTVMDTTCPNVRSAQKAAQKLAEDGFFVVIFGEASHPEVKGLLGWAGKNALATQQAKELGELKSPARLGILAQTTQSQAGFEQFVKDILTLTFDKTHEVRVINTLCRETVKRQEAALELAGESDLVIVVGGLNSANTKRLSEMCAPIVETHLIENAGEIDKLWLKGKTRIGITAGASTPDEAIREVVSRLSELAAKD